MCVRTHSYVCHSTYLEAGTPGTQFFVLWIPEMDHRVLDLWSTLTKALCWFCLQGNVNVDCILQ